MTIKKLRRKKENLEGALLGLISAFETDTDTRVGCVTVFHAQLFDAVDTHTVAADGKINGRSQESSIHDLAIDVEI